MESALSGLSNFKLDTEESSRSTFNAAIPKLLSDKPKPGHNSKEVRNTTKRESTDLTGQTKKQLFKRYSIVKTER